MLIRVLGVGGRRFEVRSFADSYSCTVGTLHGLRQFARHLSPNIGVNLTA